MDDGECYFDPYCRIADEFLEPPSRANEQECVAGFDSEKAVAAWDELNTEGGAK